MTTTTLKAYLNTSIIKKQIMALTGAALCTFLVSHLIGNCLIYVSAEAFNTYGHKLITNPLIYLAEGGLLLVFLMHLGLAIRLTLENNSARPQKYHMKSTTGRGATFASSTMPYTGLIILVFLVLHLINFKYGPVYSVTYDGVEMRDLHKLLLEYFQSPVNVVWYVFSSVALGIHVSHGFWSMFQSFGINHLKYNKSIRCLAKLYGVVMALGYSALPIYCFLQGAK